MLFLILIACFICFGPEYVRSRLCADSCQKPTLHCCFSVLAWLRLRHYKSVLRVFQYTIHTASANSVACVRNSFIRAFQYIHYTPAPRVTWNNIFVCFIFRTSLFSAEIFLILWSMEGCIMSTCNLRIPYLHVLFQIQLFKNQEWAALTFLKLINVM